MQKYSYHAFTVSMQIYNLLLNCWLFSRDGGTILATGILAVFSPSARLTKSKNYLENTQNFPPSGATPHTVTHTLGDSFKSRALLLVRASGGCLTSYSKGEGDETAPLAGQPTNRPTKHTQLVLSATVE